jgi:hypothetical protein
MRHEPKAIVTDRGISHGSPGDVLDHKPEELSFFAREFLCQVESVSPVPVTVVAPTAYRTARSSRLLDEFHRTQSTLPITLLKLRAWQ